MPLPPVRSWVTDPTFRFLARCDRCHRRRLFAPYFEVHGTVDKNHLRGCPCGEKERRAGDGVWWWECYACLIDTLTGLLEEKSCVA